MFSTRAVMLSPYNYHLYEAGSGDDLWKNSGVNSWGEAPELWRGKNYRGYPQPMSSYWWLSFGLSTKMRLWCEQEEAAWLKSITAFVMGSHLRLGAESLIRSLDPNLLKMVMPRPFDG